MPAAVSRLEAAVWRAVVRNINTDAVNLFCARRAITIAIVSAHFAVSALRHAHIVANVVRGVFRAVNTLIVIVY